MNLGDWKKILDFIATTESISAFYILLMLNQKHCSYKEDN